MNLPTLLRKAETSRFYLWLLNRGMNASIPFNKPHGFEVLEISDNHLKVLLPYKKANLNHIRGLHACALATVSEFTTGLLLIKRLGEKYRLIMQRLEMDYHYQGKIDAVATFHVDDQWLEEKILNPVKNQGSVLIVCEVKIYDTGGNHLTTGRVSWQIKDWQKVRTKVA